MRLSKNFKFYFPVVILLGLVLFIVVAIGAIKVFWPVLLLLFIFWLLSKALK